MSIYGQRDFLLDLQRRLALKSLVIYPTSPYPKLINPLVTAEPITADLLKRNKGNAPVTMGAACIYNKD